MKKNQTITIAVIGLGYVGLPLYKNLSKHYKTYGIDINKNLVKSLNINNKKEMYFDDYSCISKCNLIIVTVPTPIKNNKPDLSCIKNSYESIAKYISKNTTIVLESTVYPGITEEYCIPIIEQNSKLNYRKDFNVGYSPERVSPGDNHKNLKNITKIISGDSRKTINILHSVYSKIVKKLYVATSIKVAEASKLIENTQRDANIALINEFKMVFSEKKININDILDAAKTKWNFIDMSPGLVGGHCIGVDPYYYLEYIKLKSENKKSIVKHTRYTNEKMVDFYYEQIINYFESNNIQNSAKILILGITFKKNIDDIRNSKAIDLIKKINNKFKNVYIYDPHVDARKIFKSNVSTNDILNRKYDVVIELVNHDVHKKLEFIKKIKHKISIHKTAGFFVL